MKGSDSASGDSDFGEILARARAGEREVLGVLFERYRASLFEEARRRRPPDRFGVDDPADVVQLTFLKAYAHFDQFAGQSPAQFHAWLSGVLRRNQSDAARRKPARAVPDVVGREVAAPIRFADRPDDQPADPADEVGGREEVDNCRRMLDRLNPNDRELLDWRFGEGLSVDAIGQRLDVVAAAARKRLERAIQRARS